MKNIRLSIALAAVCLVNGCASVPDAGASKGDGIKRVYASDYSVVWEAAISTVHQTDLSMVSEDQNTGVIIDKDDWSQTSYGESVTFFVEALPNRHGTQLEVVNSAATASVLFSRDWEGILARRLDETLK